MHIHLVYFMNIIRCWSYNYEQKLTTSQVVMAQQGRQMLTLNHIKVELFWKSESQSMLFIKEIHMLRVWVLLPTITIHLPNWEWAWKRIQGDPTAPATHWLQLLQKLHEMIKTQCLNPPCFRLIWDSAIDNKYVEWYRNTLEIENGG